MIAAVRAVAWVVVDGPQGGLASGDVAVGRLTVRRRIERTLGEGTRVVDEVVVPVRSRLAAWLTARSLHRSLAPALARAVAGRTVRQPPRVRTWRLGSASLAHAEDPFEPDAGIR